MRARLFQRLTFLLLACILLTLSGCANPALKKITLLVKGNLDVIYRGVYSSQYLELSGCEESRLKQDYLRALETEAEFFARYWGILDTDPPESYGDLEADLRQDILLLLKEIYQHSSYEVETASKEDEGSYLVTVQVRPIDIMEQAMTLYENDEYEPLNQFWIRNSTTDFNQMSDQEYQDYTYEYGKLIVSLVRDQLPSLNYREPQTLTLRIQTLEGVHSIQKEDWTALDTHLIFYP